MSILVHTGWCVWSRAKEATIAPVITIDRHKLREITEELSVVGQQLDLIAGVRVHINDVGACLAVGLEEAVMPCTTARALHMQMCSEFTALGHVQWKKIEIFFWSLSVPLSPLSSHVRGLDEVDFFDESLSSLSRLGWVIFKSLETWMSHFQVSRDLDESLSSLSRLGWVTFKSLETWMSHFQVSRDLDESLSSLSRLGWGLERRGTGSLSSSVDCCHSNLLDLLRVKIVIVFLWLKRVLS
jgi:hypothetical protein